MDALANNMDGKAEGIKMEKAVGAAPEITAEETGKDRERKGIPGSTLKLMAIIVMFIDHIGAIIVERMMFKGMDAQMMNAESMPDMGIYFVDLGLRLVGRLGFPLFCFLLIEGFRHTHNVRKYAGRLLLFALVSEIPFDLAFSGTFVYWRYQNVFFTLFIGLLVLIGLRFIEEKKEWNKWLRALCIILILAAGMAAAGVMRTDYNAFGILTIVAMYQFRHSKVKEMGAGCVVLSLMNGLEASSFFAIIPAHFYNGKRGWNTKYLFYIFYPVHILALYLIACAMGLGDVMLRL